jgi:hypothetical protein
VAEPVDVVVPRGVLLDVEVGLRDVRLGLVVVVVRDEVLDRVVREELPQLVAELGGERLVVRDQERGRWTCSMIQAIVAVLPVPVAPSRVWNRSPAEIPLESSAIASGWSASGEYASDVLNSATELRLAAWTPSPTAPLRGLRRDRRGVRGPARHGRALGAAAPRDPQCQSALDFAVLSAAAFKAARTLARDDVTSFIRRPFVDGSHRAR